MKKVMKDIMVTTEGILFFNVQINTKATTIDELTYEEILLIEGMTYRKIQSWENEQRSRVHVLGIVPKTINNIEESTIFKKKVKKSINVKVLHYEMKIEKQLEG